MAKEINLTSQKWNDIVFEGKPKDYGAYEIRISSSKRHVVAFIAVVALMILVALLPLLIETVSKIRLRAENITTDTTLADLDMLEEEEEEEIIYETYMEPPPALKSTIKFTAPVIVDHEDAVSDEDLLKSQDELRDSKAQVSLFNVEGTDEEYGVDIAELESQQIIAGEGTGRGRIWSKVEQMPQFPGGEAELHKYLQKNVKYPEDARRRNIQARVMVQFTVKSDGTIEDVKVIVDPNPQLSAEAVRLVEKMPKWLPGKQNGKAVNVRFVLPIDFKLK